MLTDFPMAFLIGRMPVSEIKQSVIERALRSSVKSTISAHCSVEGKSGETIVNIKGKELGKGRPLVCVPIVEKEKEAILKAAEALTKQPADMIEWRMDWYQNSASIEEICEIIQKLSEILTDRILLCTFRSKAQGGEKEITRETYTELLQSIARQGKADMLDVEVCELEQPQALIKELQKMGAVVVASDHNFSKTPSTESMTEKLLYMKNLGADVAKLAVMPHNSYDVLNLLEATVSIKESAPEYPVITMSMGETGMISRIAGQSFGSCVTFAAAGKTSAPGQMPLEDVVMILNKISESMEK